MTARDTKWVRRGWGGSPRRHWCPGALSSPLPPPGDPTPLSSSLQLFELFSGFLKHFPGTHRQIYRNLQEINAFIGQSVEKHRETLDPSNPRDFIDVYLLRMDKVGPGRGEGRGGGEDRQRGRKRLGKGGERWRGREREERLRQVAKTKQQGQKPTEPG